MIGGISNAFAGMQSASRLFDQAATRLAGGTGAVSAEAPQAIVDTMTAKVAFEINAAVLRTTLETEKRVLDILA